VVFARLARHWLLAVNAVLAIFVAGALAAPLLAQLGYQSAAESLYTAYHLTCHQWAFRSFFLFGPQAVYSQTELAGLGIDSFAYAFVGGQVGAQSLGWKMAFCERDLAIYLGLLGVGLLYARRRGMQPPGFLLYGVLILPMALDGFTQLFGWRESTWELRTLTGLLFGMASAWLVLPRLESAMGPRPHHNQYAPEAACEPRSLLSPRG
jgi:uncharacterized membrane protein